MNKNILTKIILILIINIFNSNIFNSNIIFAENTCSYELTTEEEYAKEYKKNELNKELSILEKYSKNYDTIYNLTFSPDGKNYAFIGIKNGKDMCINTEEGSYLRCIHGDGFLIVNGKEIGEYNEIEKFIFTTDSEKYIFKAKKDGKRYIFNNEINGKKNYTEILSNKSIALLKDGIEDIIFSPDGSKSAILFFQKNKYFILYNKKKSKNYYRIKDISFSKDGKNLAYKVENIDENNFLVINGKNTKIYEYISKYFHYKDGKIVMLLTEDKTPKNQEEGYISKYTIIENGKKQKEYDYIDEDNMIFSKNNNSYAYIASIGDKEIIVKDGIESKKYDSIEKLFLSNNGEYFTAIVSEKGKNILVNNFIEKYTFYGIYQYNSDRKNIFLTNIDSINTNINRTIIKEKCLEIFKKYKKRIDEKIPKLNNKKLNSLLKKINNINPNNFNTIKYKNIFEYLKNKVKNELEKKLNFI